MPELILGIALVTLSVFILAKSLLSKNVGVEIDDQWEETKANVTRTNKGKYLLMGLTASFFTAYLITGRLLFAVLALPLGFFIAQAIQKNKTNKINTLLEEQYTQVLSVIISSLQGGSNPYQALEETVTSLKNPAKDVFIEILRRSRTGTSYYEAIGSVAEETQWQDLRQLEMAFRLYDKTGSNLIEVCTHLLKTAYDRRANKKYIDSTTAQIRATSIVLSIIPFFLMAFMRFVAPEFVNPLFYTTPGIFVVIFIVVMVYLGNKVVNKMIQQLS